MSFILQIDNSNKNYRKDNKYGRIIFSMYSLLLCIHSQLLRPIIRIFLPSLQFSHSTEPSELPNLQLHRHLVGRLIPLLNPKPLISLP